MKKTNKKRLSALLAAFTASTMLMTTACTNPDGPSQNPGGSSQNPNGHTHTYTDVVTDPTCTNEGYTTHTCSCGDSYVDTQVPALGHKYDTEILQYPTMQEPGLKNQTCKVCNDFKTVEIEALAVSSPKVAEVLVGVIGAFEAKLAVDKGSYIIMHQKYEGNDPNIASNQSGKVSLEVAEAEVNTKSGTLSAHMEVEIKMEYIEANAAGQELSKSEKVGTISVYVNGDNVAVSVTTPDGSNSGEFNVSEMAYNVLSQEMGLEYDQLVTLMYTVKEMCSYLPNVLEMAIGETPKITESYIQSVQAVFNLVGEDIIKETQQDGNNVYTLDFTALGHFVDEIEGETVASYIDKVYGAGSMKALTDYAVGLPAMTIREAVNNAVTVSETYGIDIDNIYYLINLYAMQMGAQGFDVEKEIEKYYDKTLGGLIIEASDEQSLTVEQMQTTISTYLETIGGLTADGLYTMITGTEGSFSEWANAVINALPEMYSASMMVNANGGFAGVRLGVAGTGAPATEFALTVGEDAFAMSLTQGTENNISFAVNGTGSAADVTINGYDYLDFESSVSGGVTEVDATFRGWQSVYAGYDEYGDPKYVDRFYDLAAIEYENNNGIVNAEVELYDEGVAEARVELSNAKTDSENIFTMNVYGLVGTSFEPVGEMKFGYRMEGNKTTYFASACNIEDGQKEEDLLSYEEVVENGEVKSYTLEMLMGGLVRASSGSSYLSNGNYYRDVEEIREETWVYVSYVATENGGKWTITQADTETRSSYKELYDSNDNWVKVAGSEVILDQKVDEQTMNFEYVLTESTFEVITDQGAVKFELADQGMSVSFTAGAMEVMAALNEIAGGYELVVDAADLGVGFTLSVTNNDGKIHVGYDLEKLVLGNGQWLEGEGGCSVSLS